MSKEGIPEDTTRSETGLANRWIPSDEVGADDTPSAVTPTGDRAASLDAEYWHARMWLYAEGQFRR